MESDLFANAVHSLRQPQDKRKLLQILIVIRKGIDESSSRSEKLKILNESSCVKNLMGCLQLESSNVLDITLSILGNGCIDSNFARNAMKLNILHYLDRVLGRHKKDSIVGRIFRIIGNLCDNVCSAMIMAKEPQLIDKIVGLLNEAATANDDTNTSVKVSEATMLMALRTVRKLLKKSTLENLIVKHGILKAVGAVLIQYGNDQWDVNTSSANIIEEILRLLYSYSRYAHPQIVPSLKNTKNGDSLVTLGKLITLNPSRVMKIITNLNKCCSLKSDLPMPDVWQKLLQKIKSNGVTENIYIEYLRSMHELIDHPSNREYIRLGDSICDLINVLKEFTDCTDFSMECCTIILSMLKICQFDDTLVLKQISAGIVNVLVDKLEWTGVSSVKVSVPNHVKKKRKMKDHVENETKKLKLFLERDGYSCLNDTVFPCEDRCSSPSEFSEISSNGPYSPGCAAITEDVSDSDNYSPVCSDAEDTDVNSIPSLDPECATPSDNDDIASSINVRIKYRFLHEINALLWRYSRIEPAVAELGNPKLLTTLMNIAFSNENSISPHKFVMFVMRKPDYLIQLMQTNFIQMVFDLTMTAHDMKICHSCKHAHETATIMLDALTGVAESGGAKGNIAHILLRSNVQIKNKIVLAIPYIVRNKHTVTKLLINCGGLDILLNLLEKKSDLQEDSIKGLCILAIHQLKIKNPIHNQPQRQVLDLDVNSYSLPETCLNVVTFKLDDESTVPADRDFLSDKSDYFNRLLNGNFMESEQSEITLQNISVRSLKILLILLHCNTAAIGVVNVDLDTLLDLLEITERYLLVELNVYLMNCVEQLHMSNRTVPIIYQWSIESGTNILRVETIAFALVGNILDADRIHMFHDLFGLGYYKQLRDDIQKLLVRFLR